MGIQGKFGSIENEVQLGIGLNEVVQEAKCENLLQSNLAFRMNLLNHFIIWELVKFSFFLNHWILGLISNGEICLGWYKMNGKISGMVNSQVLKGMLNLEWEFI